MTITPFASLDERAAWVANTPNRVATWRVISHIGWVVYSEPEMHVYTDREKTVSVALMEDLIPVMAALGWLHMDDISDIPRADNALATVRYVMGLMDVMSVTEVASMNAMGLSAEEARMLAVEGVDSDLMKSVIAGQSA